MPKNLEFKARVRELNPLEEEFKSKGAEFVGVLKQCDTYFNVQGGRLKLREVGGRPGELIFYKRNEASSSEMESRYSVLPVRDASLKSFLSESLGVKVVVVKERRLLMLKNARIHLDDVKGLGKFLEFEVVSAESAATNGNDEDDAALLGMLKEYAAPFVVREINESYSDLMLKDKISSD